MSLRIRRGTEAQRRTGFTFDLGELVVTTDEFKLFVGDGVTPGGRNIAQNLAGQGLSYNATTGRLDAATVTLTSDDVAEGNNNQYFTTERAQDAVGAALTAGNQFNQNIQFTYDDFNNRITAEVTLDGVGIASLFDDKDPALGANLDLNNYDVVGTGNISIVGNIEATGSVTATGGLIGPATITDLVSYGSPTLDAASTHYGITDGPAGAWIDLKIAKNNWSNELPIVAEDNIGGFRVNALADGSYKIVSALDTVLTADADVTATFPASKMLVGVGNNIDITLFEFNHSGAFIAPIVQTGVYTTLPSTPAKGMIVFNDSTGKFQGYDGTTWVDLN